MQPFNVAVCSSQHPHLEPVFDALCDALPAHGYRARRFPSPHALIESPALLGQTQVIAGFGNMPISAAVLRSVPRLRGVVSCVSGTDGFDVPTATAMGVLVAHAPTFENARGMAEAALMLMLNLSYDLDRTRENFRLGLHRPDSATARLLHGQTIGLVGWGRIAANLAALLQPWGVRLLVYSRRGTPPDLPAHASAVSLVELMAASDQVCVLAGAQANAKPIVGALELARMKPSAFLINLSRGSTVDETALAITLREQRIAGAALDVFAVEPLPADSPLRTCPNVILTGHHVGHTLEADQSLAPTIIANVLALLDGVVPSMVRNPEVIDTWRKRWGGRPAIEERSVAARYSIPPSTA